jgi:nucleoside-diphosphate-sugar epimerase
MKLRVLVTGATGFIGNYVINELLKNKDIEIIATARAIESAKTKNWYEQVTFIPFSINENSLSNQENLHTYFQKPDALIHLAWEGLPNYKQLFHFESVLPRQYIFLKNLIENGLTNINIVGTCFEYGLQEGKLKEDMATIPDNPYGLAKDTLRKQLELLAKNCHFDLKWIRLFYLFGLGQNPNSILSQLDKAIEKKEAFFNMSGGEQLRDYLDVSTVAENIVKITLQKSITGVINCCSGKPISISNLVETRITEKKSTIKSNKGYYPYPDFEPFAFWGDTTKLDKIIKISTLKID